MSIRAASRPIQTSQPFQLSSCDRVRIRNQVLQHKVSAIYSAYHAIVDMQSRDLALLSTCRVWNSEHLKGKISTSLEANIAPITELPATIDEPAEVDAQFTLHKGARDNDAPNLQSLWHSANVCSTRRIAQSKWCRVCMTASQRHFIQHRQELSWLLARALHRQVTTMLCNMRE